VEEAPTLLEQPKPDHHASEPNEAKGLGQKWTAAVAIVTSELLKSDPSIQQPILTISSSGVDI
jgi:hypothetical protein